ncbi:hypothetical protein [Spirosoma daeguense]
MIRVCIAVKPQRGLLAIASLMTMLCMASCQHETIVDPRVESPRTDIVEIPTIQDDGDDDAPPKNGHGGRLIQKPVSAPNEFSKIRHNTAH